MALLFVRFSALLLLGLAAGGALCIVMLDRCLGSSGTFYVEYKQMSIRALTVPLPAFGLLASLAVLVDCYAQWRNGGGTALWLALAAFVLSLSAGVLTKLGHFPLNAMIASWDPASPPPIWTSIHAKWTMLHLARTSAAVLASALMIVSNLLRST